MYKGHKEKEREREREREGERKREKKRYIVSTLRIAHELNTSVHTTAASIEHNKL